MANDHEIGYGKPPRATQFRKGESGNPQGRPKGSVNAATLFHQVSRQRIPVKDGNSTRLVPKIEVALTQLMNKAASGDLKAIRDVFQLERLFRPELESEREQNPDEEKDDLVMRLLRRTFGNNEQSSEVKP